MSHDPSTEPDDCSPIPELILEDDMLADTQKQRHGRLPKEFCQAPHTQVTQTLAIDVVKKKAPIQLGDGN